MFRLIFYLQKKRKMDNQNGTAQLRYLEEISARLRRMGFETVPVEDQQFPVKWDGSQSSRMEMGGMM